MCSEKHRRKKRIMVYYWTGLVMRQSLLERSSSYNTGLHCTVLRRVCNKVVKEGCSFFFFS